jgi:hypothetical protein
MRWRHYLCALIMLFASIGLSRADVTYSYVAGNPGESVPVMGVGGGTTSVTGGTAAWTGTTGQVLQIPIYLLETVTPTASVTGNATTSIINTYWTDNNSAFVGVGSVGFGLAQTGLASGATTSQIGSASDVVWTPPSGAAGNKVGGTPFPGVQNTTGFTFGDQFAGTFTLRSPGTATGGNVANRTGVQGGSDLSVIYQNLNNANGYNGNNLQVAASLEQTGTNGQNNTISQGATTNGLTLSGPNGNYVGTGVVLVGTVSVTVGTGKTTFQLTPLGSSQLTGPTSSSFNPSFDGFLLARTNTGSSTNGLSYAVGQFSGLPTPLSGGTQDTILGNNVLSNGTTNNVSLDQSFAAINGNNPRGSSSTFDTWISLASFNNGDQPLTGPNIMDGGAGSTSLVSSIPYYGANSTPFTITVTGPAAVPEPSSMALCGFLTLAGGCVAAKRRRKVA